MFSVRRVNAGHFWVRFKNTLFFWGGGGGIKHSQYMVTFEGIPENHGALFGLVSYNDPCSGGICCSNTRCCLNSLPEASSHIVRWWWRCVQHSSDSSYPQSWFSGKWQNTLKGNYFWRYTHFSLNHDCGMCPTSICMVKFNSTCSACWSYDTDRAHWMRTATKKKHE